jgi:hypothetical protein
MQEKMVSENKYEEVEKQISLSSEGGEFIIWLHYPMTEEYFNQFLNSQTQFSYITFGYMISPDPSNWDLQTKLFDFNIGNNADSNEEMFINYALNDVIYYPSHYFDESMNTSFSYELSSNLIQPIYGFVSQNPDYYFSGEEFHGEECLNTGVGSDFGHSCFITLSIQAPDCPIENCPCKAFCKGWNANENPPEELIPLINYLENVIIPKMRQHPWL